MKETPPVPDDAEFSGREAAVYLGTALLVALFLALVLTWRDNGRRAALETTVELTSVGDANFFPMSATPPPPPYLPVAYLDGQPLYPVDYDRHGFHADDMTRVGLDAKGGYFVYQAPERAKTPDEAKRGAAYYLKISPTEYLKTHAIPLP